MIMKKYLCLIIACVLSFMLIGCSNNADVNEITTPYENSTEVELTNPGEYLADLCSDIKINEIEFSLPCSREELSKKFTVEPIIHFDTEYEPKNEKYKFVTYNLFTNDDCYCGPVTFAEYPDNTDKIYLFERGEKILPSYLPKDKRFHADDSIMVKIDFITVGETTKEEVNSKIGKGISFDEETNDESNVGYIFEDGILRLKYYNNIVSEFKIIFYQ